MLLIASTAACFACTHNIKSISRLQHAYCQIPSENIRRVA